jgi:exodeoxyribonuclease VII large subunit
VPVLAEIAEQLRVAGVRLGRAARQGIHHKMLQLERLRGRLGTPERLVDRRRIDIDNTTSRLQTALQMHLRRKVEAFGALQIKLRAVHPRARLVHDRATLQQLEQRARGQINTQLESCRASLATRCAALQALSPLGVLARGYSLVLDARGKLVRDAASVARDDELRVRLHRGALGCRVTSRDVDPDA